MKCIESLGFDLISSDLMSILNFGYIYLLNKNFNKAQDFYCWAIQHNFGSITNIQEVIKTDLISLNINETINLSCKERVVLTIRDAEVKNLEYLINSKRLYQFGKTYLKFLGNGQILVEIQDKKYFGRVKRDDHSNWLHFYFEESINLFEDYKYDKYYALKLENENKIDKLIDLNDNKKFFIKI